MANSMKKSSFQPQVVSSIPIPKLRRRLKQHLPDDSLASVQLELDYGRSNGIEGEAAAVNESRDVEFRNVRMRLEFMLQLS